MEIDISSINTFDIPDLSLGGSSQNWSEYLSLNFADIGVDNNFDPL